MVEYTLLDKIKTFFNLVIESPLFLILLLGIILMIVDILLISKKDRKTKTIYTIVSFILVIFFMNSYIESILKIFDSIIKNIVAIIYFPTVLQYILMLIISIIILIVSIFSKKMNKVIKRINAFILITNSFLFFLILDAIANSNVDLSNKVSIYTNSSLMMLLELSLIIFVVWIIGLILYKVIKLLSPKEKYEEVQLQTGTFYNEIEMPKKLTDLKKPNLKIENEIMEKQKKEEIFSLEDYRQMRALLELLKNNKKDF